MQPATTVRRGFGARPPGRSVGLMSRSERQGRGGGGLDLASRAWVLIVGQDRYQSTGRPRPRVGLSGARRLVIRVVAPLALLGLAWLYWIWPNDLVPDRLPLGRADDVAVAFVNMFLAIRIVAGRRGAGASGDSSADPLTGDTSPARTGAAKPRGAREIDAIAAVLAAHGAPIVVYNALHRQPLAEFDAGRGWASTWAAPTSMP